MAMRIIDSPDEMTETARNWLASRAIGFVPTRGNLHEGHRALIQTARDISKILAVGLLDKHRLFATCPHAFSPLAFLP